MSKRIFITSTNTNVGKTYTTIELLKTYTHMGYKVGVFKPIETGVNGLPPDGSLLLKHLHACNPKLKSFKIHDIVPMALNLPAAPFVANKGKQIDLDLLDKALAKIEKQCDIVLIEGAGGLLVPVDDKVMMIDLIGHFKATALLVSHCRLGCINDTLLNLNLLEQHGVPHLWTLNCRADDEDFSTVSLPYFKHRFDTFFILQHNPTALAQALLDKIDS